MAKVLIVEDDPRDVVRMLECLRREISMACLAHEVVHVTNRADAVAQLTAEAYDLVSLDGRFPVSHGGRLESEAGLGVLKHLELLGHNGHTVFYTGSNEQLPEARKMVVAGKPVHARAKMLQHSAEEGWETIATWAQMCAGLLKP